MKYKNLHNLSRKHEEVEVDDHDRNDEVGDEADSAAVTKVLEVVLNVVEVVSLNHAWQWKVNEHLKNKTLDLNKLDVVLLKDLEDVYYFDQVEVAFCRLHRRCRRRRCDLKWEQVVEEPSIDVELMSLVMSSE